MEKQIARDKQNKNIYKIAMLVAVSCVLQISESLIPHPIPGLRLGLANVMTLIALVTLGFGPALEVAILRTILSAFLMGTFMSPAFILSFSAACVSTFIMGFLYWLSSFHRYWRLSIVGISILAALTHNFVQLYLAYLILIRHQAIFIFLPWLAIGAVIMGWLTGVIAGNVCLKVKNKEQLTGLITPNHPENSSLKFRSFLAGSSYLHRLGANLKITVLFVLSLAVLIFANLWFYLSLSFFLLAITLLSKTSFSFLFVKIKKSLSLIFISFLFPLLFNSGKHTLLSIAFFKINADGLIMGTIFAFRILFLISASSLLVRTTSPEDLTRGLSRVLSLLRFAGISRERTAAILSLSWTTIPFLWEKAANAIRSAKLNKIKNLRNLIPLLSDIVAMLYLETEQMSVVSQAEQEILRKEEATYEANELSLAGNGSRN